jgi:hypothetical protein
MSELFAIKKEATAQQMAPPSALPPLARLWMIVVSAKNTAIRWFAPNIHAVTRRKSCNRNSTVP